MSYDHVLKLQFKIAYDYGMLHPNYDDITRDILISHGYKRIPMVTTHQSIAQFMYEHKEGRCNSWSETYISIHQWSMV